MIGRHARPRCSWAWMCWGVAGVILQAKSEGYVEAVRPLLDGLHQNGLRLHDDIYDAVLRTAGEEPR